MRIGWDYRFQYLSCFVKHKFFYDKRPTCYIIQTPVNPITKNKRKYHDSLLCLHYTFHDEALSVILNIRGSGRGVF